MLIFDKDKLVKIGRMYEDSDRLKAEGIEGSEGGFDTLQPKNTDSHEGKVIQNCITFTDKVPIMPSVPSGFQVCPYCEILGHGRVEFSSEDLLERHGVQKHPGWPIHSKPDIEKFRQEQDKKEKRDEGLSG